MRSITAATMSIPVFFGIFGDFRGDPAGIPGWIVGAGTCGAGDGESGDGVKNGSCAGGGGGGMGGGTAGELGCFTGAPQYSQKFLSCPTSFPHEVQNRI